MLAKHVSLWLLYGCCCWRVPNNTKTPILHTRGVAFTVHTRVVSCLVSVFTCAGVVVACCRVSLSWLEQTVAGLSHRYVCDDVFHQPTSELASSFADADVIRRFIRESLPTFRLRIPRNQPWISRPHNKYRMRDNSSRAKMSPCSVLHESHTNRINLVNLDRNYRLVGIGNRCMRKVEKKI